MLAVVIMAAGAELIPKNIGLYISPADRAKEVTTPGGGGDKVSYHPYADMETGLYKVLGNTFQSVDSLSTLSDVNTIAKHSLTLIAIPEITTTSSSSGVFTWMATDFTVQLSCRFTDLAGREVATISSTGTGHAEFSVLKSDFSVAGERASRDALEKFQAAVLQSEALRKAPTAGGRLSAYDDSRVPQRTGEPVQPKVPARDRPGAIERDLLEGQRVPGRFDPADRFRGRRNVRRVHAPDTLPTLLHPVGQRGVALEIESAASTPLLALRSRYRRPDEAWLAKLIGPSTQGTPPRAISACGIVYPHGLHACEDSLHSWRN